MSEDQLKDAIIDLAMLLGWHVAHFRPARTSRGWRTPMQGNPGYPDLTMAKNGRVIFAELKAKGEKPRPDQRAWLDALAGDERPHPPVEVYVFWPEDWLDGTVERLLRGAENVREAA